MQFSATSLLIILAMSGIGAANDFKYSCGDCYFEQTGFSCECGAGRTYLDLNPYLGNYGGQLKWGSSQFSAACRDCYMLADGGLFGCSCGKGVGGYADTYIDLNPYISTIDNKLHVD